MGRFSYFVAVAALGISTAVAQPLSISGPEGDSTPTHDPVLICAGDIYYSSATGGTPMLEGGGTVLLRADPEGQDRCLGPGHAGHLRDSDGRDYLIYHAYDRLARGKPTLRISRLEWDRDGWPQIQH